MKMWKISIRKLTLVFFCGILRFSGGTCPVPACYCNFSGDVVPIMPKTEGNEVLTGVVAALISTVITGGAAIAIWHMMNKQFEKPTLKGYKRQASNLSSRSLTRDAPTPRVMHSKKHLVEDRLAQNENTNIGTPKSGPHNVNVYRAFGFNNDRANSSMSYGETSTDW